MRIFRGSLCFFLAGALAVGAAEPWTLPRALDYALTHNPDARIAQQRIAGAQAVLEQASAAYWPRVQLQSGYTRTDNPMQVFGNILNQRAYTSSLNFNDVPAVDDVNVRGVVTVPLYAGGRTVAGRQAATANRAAARQDSAAVRNLLGFQVTAAFHTIQKTRQFIQAAEAAVLALTTNVVVAQHRLDAGTLLKSDVLDLEVHLAQAREDLVRAQNSAALAELALHHLLGLEEGDFAVSDMVPVVRAPAAGILSQRPEFAAARERAKAAEAQVRGAQSGHQPRVNAFASLDYDYGPITHGDGRSYGAGVLVQWDLWDGWATRGKVREAEAGLQTAREEERKLRLALNFEIEQARRNLSAADERLLVGAKTVEQATQSAEITRHRFEQGAALPTQLLDAESALVAARVRRTQAEADQRIAVAALRQALALPQLDDPSVAQ